LNCLNSLLKRLHKIYLCKMSLNVSESEAMKFPINASSWSFTDDELAIKYDHLWSIANFDTKMTMETGQILKSGSFSVNFKGESTEWSLEMYPNGERDNDKGYVSLFLTIANHNVILEPVEVEAFFYIVNQQGVKNNSFKFKKLYRNRGDGYGSKQYIKHSDINLPSNKIFTILCEMSLIGDIVVSSGSYKSSTKLREDQPIKTNLSPLDMSSFIDSGEFSDCIVTCGDKEFKCHKIVLAGRSSVFKAMFSNKLMENKTSKVVIEDLDENTVSEMINYIYSGNLEMNFDDQAIELFTAADKYDLKDLKEMCESHIREEISIANVCDILILAYLHNSKSLLDVSFQFICNNGEEVLEETGFKEKLKLYPDILMKMLESFMKNQILFRKFCMDL